MVAAPSDSNQPRSVGLSLLAFSRLLRATWVVIFALTVASEVYTFPLMAPLPFYAIACSKLLLFLMQGFIAPLAFWRFSTLNRGVVLAVSSASLIEGLQGLLKHGHAFHWYELLVKLALILAGFVAGLGAVHDREIVIGPLRVTLTGKHLDSTDLRP